MKTIYLLKKIFLGTFALFHFIANAQFHKTYKGAYHNGYITYSYLENKDGKHIYNGPFTYNETLNKKTKITIKGNFINNKRNGLWTKTLELPYKTEKYIAYYKNGYYTGKASLNSFDKKGNLKSSFEIDFGKNNNLKQLKYQSKKEKLAFEILLDENSNIKTLHAQYKKEKSTLTYNNSLLENEVYQDLTKGTFYSKKNYIDFNKKIKYDSKTKHHIYNNTHYKLVYIYINPFSLCSHKKFERLNWIDYLDIFTSDYFPFKEVLFFEIERNIIVPERPSILKYIKLDNDAFFIPKNQYKPIAKN
ncbi:hypothetical protein QVZ41_03575 [Wenyingzhuangia sp. chi5]|uniref:MORN repeat protein n=1 Tax=Wenyingzhuangia gilva TaxID=3057677 RepID=A0ABT8VPM5_9FLAO|nr:hypothetical protein [Wenyingzhuangia sp. chi5]MDO3693928.1 hypothetical protein [Wenyingzhuangia sp. chi5]